MAWQIRREIGAAAAALGRAPDAIVLTGGLAHDKRLNPMDHGGSRMDRRCPVLSR